MPATQWHEQFGSDGGAARAAAATNDPTEAAGFEDPHAGPVDPKDLTDAELVEACQELGIDLTGLTDRAEAEQALRDERIARAAK